MENKKRCPKCGEDNPPEAVMCWACYTPLSSAGAGGSSAPSKTAKSPAPIIGDDDDADRKPAVAPWQIAVIVIGLLFGLYTVGKNFLPSGGSDDTIPAASAPDMPPDSGGPPPAASSPSSSQPSSANVTAVTPEKLPFTIAVSPNPNITVGTMAIVPTDPNISTGQAASLASFTMSQFTQMKRWKKLYIFVFQTKQSANQFSDYQRTRRGAPLREADYRNLTNLWGSALSCYEYDHGRYQVFTPTNNPSGWWSR